MKSQTAPALSRETAQAIFRKILLSRKCEEAIRREYASDMMKTPVHLCNGAEAIAAGIVASLPPQTAYYGTYRNHGLYLSITEDTDGFFAELYGKNSGCAHGRAGSMHLTAPGHGFFLTSAVVATTIPVAVGTAFANQYLGKSDYVAAFFGDGALEEGSFWESFNFACLHKLRILFICEDNDLAIHTPRRDRQAFRSITDVLAGFDCHLLSEKGHLPQSVYQAAQSVLAKMKSDVKPAFFHFPYFRFLEHVGVHEDFQFNYRQKPGGGTFAEWDPVLHAQKWLKELNYSDSELEKIDRALDEKISASIDKAKKSSFPPPESLGDHVLS